MKAILLTGALLLSACAAPVPMAELEAQAMLTSDWTAVERRERQMARRAERVAQNCGPGFVNYCVNFGSDDRCACVAGQALTDVFSSRR